MYEREYKGNEVVRQLRFHQGKRNEYERRGLYDAIERKIPYAPHLIEFPNEITVRTERFSVPSIYERAHISRALFQSW